jgi:hypothetical protein
MGPRFHGNPHSMREAVMQAAVEEVEVRTAVANVVFGDRAWPLGSSLRVPGDVAARWRANGLVKASPIVRARRANLLVGNRTLALGETGTALSIEHARRLHEDGSADFLNAADLGLSLGPRNIAGGQPIPDGHRVVRAKRPLSIHGGKRAIEPGKTFDLPANQAIEVCRRGDAEPVGWTVPPVETVRVTALKPCRAGTHVLAVGESTDVEQDEAMRLMSAGVVRRGGADAAADAD